MTTYAYPPDDVRAKHLLPEGFLRVVGTWGLTMSSNGAGSGVWLAAKTGHRVYPVPVSQEEWLAWEKEERP